MHPLRAHSLAKGRAALGIALLLCAAGCMQRAARGAPKYWPAADWIVDGRTGERSTFEKMMEDLAQANVVFVGEDHHNRHHHEAQRRIAEALAARQPDLAMGMEMLQTTSQAAADRWVAGDIDLGAFVAETEWKRTWGYDVELYRPLLELARERRLPLIALNAPENVVKRIREVGVDGLDAAERAAIPEMDLTNDAHRDWVKLAMGAHHALDPARFERAYSIQVLWDETMAETTARTLRGPPPRPMVVFAGTGHVIRRMGIPARVERRMPQAKTRVVLALPVLQDTPREIRASVEQRDADWLWITPDEDAR